MHKNITTEIETAIQQHAEGIRLLKHDLDNGKQELIEAYDTAVRHHQTFINETKLPENWELCGQWELNFTNYHNAAIQKINEHLTTRSTTDSIIPDESSSEDLAQQFALMTEEQKKLQENVDQMNVNVENSAKAATKQAEELKVLLTNLTTGLGKRQDDFFTKIERRQEAKEANLLHHIDT